MRPIRLLVVEGNTAEGRARHRAFWGADPSQSYADALRRLDPQAITDICYPADPGANLPGGAGIADYDGVVLTGSSLHLWKAEPEAVRQVEFARSIYAAGVPFFGSCWGLQVATVAAGGDVHSNPRGREAGIARKIRLTEAGRSHPMHAGRPPAFDAPAVHRDEVSVRPEGMVVTAENAMSAVQGAEIRYAGGAFWGVQYHPEFSLAELASILRRARSFLIEEGFFQGEADAEAYAGDLCALDAEPARFDLAWRYGLDADVLDPGCRTREIANWLSARVYPEASARGRA